MVVSQRIYEYEALPRPRQVGLNYLITARAMNLSRSRRFGLLLLILTTRTPNECQLNTTLILYRRSRVVTGHKIQGVNNDITIKERLLGMNTPLF